jgi:hypothetical protein
MGARVGAGVASLPVRILSHERGRIVRLRRIIDINLLTNRSQQSIQVDLYTGHRTTIVRTVKDVVTKAGITTGTITIEHQDYTVRQVGKSNEWYFCDANGQRIRQEFDKQNNDERNFREKRERGE